MAPEFQTLQVERSADGIIVLTLDRPDRANAMTPVMFDELLAFTRSLEKDREARVVILAGAGTVFCAGYDMADAAALPELGAIGFLDLQETAARALSSIRALAIPVIAAVNGAAAGGGLALALSADIRLASPTAKFNAAFVKIGLSAGDLGTSWLLPRVVGPGRANEIAFTGRLVDAVEAERIGLVNAISAEGALIDDARAMAALIVANSPAGVRVSKAALRTNLDIPYAAAMELENRGQTLLTATTDMPEALAAFGEKRPPRFTGH